MAAKAQAARIGNRCMADRLSGFRRGAAVSKVSKASAVAAPGAGDGGEEHATTEMKPGGRLRSLLPGVLAGVGAGEEARWRGAEGNVDLGNAHVTGAESVKDE